MAVISSYFWAQFPYDNVCSCDNTNDYTCGGQDWRGTYNDIILGNSTAIDQIEVTQKEGVIFCQQQLWRLPEFAFPPVSEVQELRQGKWMTSETWEPPGNQESLTKIYGWSSVVALAVYVAFVFGGSVISNVLLLFRGSYSTNTKDSKIDFSTVQEIFAYVPQLDFPPFPMLACDVDDIDQNLIGWNDPHGSYDTHNLIFDVPWPGMKRRQKITENTRNTTNIAHHADYESHGGAGDHQNEASGLSAESRPIFSTVKHWPPEWAKNGASVTPSQVMGV
eukprot:CAMPEP_0113596990 /NCGR_PEP_ID=MMETSP0015_2-20120614/40688_1 /TAXON_ID=2838 /ORGANISM="Odontella" /LENGTH=277 /DNA_ID=CAMNT_0000504657 /DNA_START=101 /DNA_END=934 /DNA_ORIENTATION=- /assembly_acc=CAM_ASM_000160